MRALAIFLLVASLVAFAQAADIAVMVGDGKGGNVFVPATAPGAPGDNIVFTWADAAKHSVIQSDDAKSCAKSKAADAFTTGGPLVGPATKTVPIPKDAKGKWWFYCGVPGHCFPGTGGMTLTIDLTPPAGGPSMPIPSPSPSVAMPGTPTEMTLPVAAVASRSYNYFSAGVVFSSTCMAFSYIL